MFYTDAAGGVYKTSVWWLISTSTFYFQPPAHMSRQRAQRRHSSGSGVPHPRWGLHRCVNSCNGCWVGSYGERMFKRARGTDVAGKRLPRQTIPKSVFSDEGGTGVRCMQIILYFSGGPLGWAVCLRLSTNGRQHRQFGSTTTLAHQCVPYAGHPHHHRYRQHVPIRPEFWSEARKNTIGCRAPDRNWALLGIPYS